MCFTLFMSLHLLGLFKCVEAARGQLLSRMAHQRLTIVMSMRRRGIGRCDNPTPISPVLACELNGYCYRMHPDRLAWSIFALGATP